MPKTQFGRQFSYLTADQVFAMTDAQLQADHFVLLEALEHHHDTLIMRTQTYLDATSETAARTALRSLLHELVLLSAIHNGNVDLLKNTQ